MERDFIPRNSGLSCITLKQTSRLDDDGPARLCEREEEGKRVSEERLKERAQGEIKGETKCPPVS